jgi:hypothetical protein
MAHGEEQGTRGRWTRMREWRRYRRERREWRRERLKGTIDPGGAPMRADGASAAASAKGAPSDGPAAGFGGGI